MAVTTSTTKGSFSGYFYPAQQVVPNALAFTQATYTGEIEGDAPSMYVPYISTPPVAEIVAEGDEIDDSKAASNEIAIQTRKVAVLSIITNEARRAGGGDIQARLASSLAEAIVKKADAVFLQNEAPAEGAAPSQPTGLFNYPGVLQGGNVTTSLDPVIDALADISTNGGTPTGIILSPATWASLLKLKYTDGRPLIDPASANSPAPVLFGIPVVLNTQAPTGKLLINDKTEVLAAIGKVASSATAERYFERDSFASRVTLRLGWGIIHPNRLAVVNINTTATTK